MTLFKMKENLAYLIIGIVVILFFYFGYKDDYKRNPNEFIKTIIGVPIGIFSSVFGIFGLTDWIQKWIKKENRNK